MTLAEWIYKWRPEFYIESKVPKPGEPGIFVWTYRLYLPGHRRSLGGECESTDAPMLDNLLLGFAWDLSLYYEEMPIDEFAKLRKMSIRDSNIIQEYRTMMAYIDALREGLGSHAIDTLSEVRW